MHINVVRTLQENNTLDNLILVLKFSSRSTLKKNLQVDRHVTHMIRMTLYILARDNKTMVYLYKSYKYTNIDIYRQCSRV